ncbi:MAG: hypothetical protein K6B46_05650 [Opitutales bacterium]|nr:hypothetical protein [Opitutales bacterium]
MNVYLLIGTPHCGRRAILADLLDYGLGSGTKVTVWLPEEERDETADEPLQKMPALDLRSWKLVPADSPKGVPAIEFENNFEPEDYGFFVLNGRRDPIGQIEAFADLVKRYAWSLVRVILVVDSKFAKAVPETADFYKALIHFSDVVLFANRGDISSAWFEAFKKPYRDECYPCIFELVKKNRVKNAVATLADTPRRMTMIFDDIDPLDDMEFDEDNLPTEPFDIVAKPDPYFERNEHGARLIVVPDIEELLKKNG